jgi:hypothetical protein
MYDLVKGRIIVVLLSNNMSKEGMGFLFTDHNEYR